MGLFFFGQGIWVTWRQRVDLGGDLLFQLRLKLLKILVELGGLLLNHLLDVFEHLVFVGGGHW